MVRLCDKRGFLVDTRNGFVGRVMFGAIVWCAVTVMMYISTL